MVCEAKTSDLKVLAELAVCMWDSQTVKELEEDFAEIMEKEDARFFLKYEQEQPIGFAQCQLRHDYVEGTESSPVGYLEGIFVKTEYRHKGYAKELLNA